MQRRLNRWIAALSILLFILPVAFAAGFSVYTYQSQNYLVNPWFVPEIPYSGPSFQSPCAAYVEIMARHHDTRLQQFGPAVEYCPAWEKDEKCHLVIICADWKLAPTVKGIVRAANQSHNMNCRHEGKCTLEFALVKYSQQELMDYYDRLDNGLPEKVRNQIMCMVSTGFEDRPRNRILIYAKYYVTPEIREAVEALVPADAVEYLLGTPPLVQPV